MARRYSDDRTWDFSRCPISGHLMLWPRQDTAPRWVGQAEAAPPAADSPAFTITPSAVNQSLPIIRLFRSRQNWSHGRPVAVFGEVAAGRFDVTVAYWDSSESQEVLMLPPNRLPPNCFALRVRGNSMEEAGIQDGDYALIRPQNSADNGDLVIATLTDSDDPAGYATLKQFFREGDRVRLQPANATMGPIHLYPQRGRDPIQIQGKVIAVVRQEAIVG